jgi:dTDP-4-dehydrorhamnose 3,5-epimerase
MRPIVLKNKLYSDNRGYFREYFKNKIYSKKINVNFCQDNISYSKKNVIRGLHFRIKPQVQIISLLKGSIFDVVVNIDKSSKNFGQVYEYYLDSEKDNQLILPGNYAHGFCVLSSEAIMNYKTNKYYNKKFEGGIIWNDKTLKINWPVKKPIISIRDKKFREINDIRF